MRRSFWLIGLLIWSGLAGADAQESSDSLRVQILIDTLTSFPKKIYVIPSGPEAGSFTPESRLTVVDTVAGWAKIMVEGWVPVGDVLSRMTAPVTAQAGFQTDKSQIRQRCAAITSKGKRCKRKSEPGSARCWQHQE